MQNPEASEVKVDLSFMISAGPRAGPQDVPVPSSSRRTFKLNDYITDWNVSTKVVATAPVVCERAIYGGNRAWAHDSIGYSPGH